MKAIFYGTNLLLVLLILLVLKQVKNLKNDSVGRETPIVQSAEPLLEDLPKSSLKSLPSDLIIQKSIFHQSRQGLVKKELSPEELEKKIKGNKNYILTGIIQFGDAVAFIAIEEGTKKLKRPTVPRVNKGLEKHKSLGYKIGDQLKDSTYILTAINVQESYVILRSGRQELKLELFTQNSKDLAETERRLLNEQKRHLKKKLPKNISPKPNKKRPLKVKNLDKVV